MLKACLWHQVGFGVVPSHKGKAFVLEIIHVEGEVSASIGHGSERIIISGSWDLQIGTLSADDSHRVFQATSCLDLCPLKCSTPVLTGGVSVRNCKFNIEGAVQYV